MVGARTRRSKPRIRFLSIRQSLPLIAAGILLVHVAYISFRTSSVTKQEDDVDPRRAQALSIDALEPPSTPDYHLDKPPETQEEDDQPVPVKQKRHKVKSPPTEVLEGGDVAHLQSVRIDVDTIDPADLAGAPPLTVQHANLTSLPNEPVTKDTPLPSCHAILPKHLLSEQFEGVALAGKLPIKHMTHIFRYNSNFHYAHMAMLERVVGPSVQEHDGVMIAAWQAAPAVPPDKTGRQTMAVEGLEAQRILFSLSYDKGHKWTEAAVVPTHEFLTAHDAKTSIKTPAVWSPVLHCDPATGRVYLFYTESSSCWRPTTPPSWEPGGHIKVLVADNIGHPGVAPKWHSPRVLLSESSQGGIPKVIANKLVVLETGEWVLPYWREQPKWEHMADAPEGFVSSCHAAAPNKTKGAEQEPSKTAAGVLTSTDRGATWNAYGGLTDPRSDLIEGTVAPLRDNELSMLLRSNTGCTFSTRSQDRGRTWSKAEPISLPNPNSKSHMVSLSPSGTLAIAFNNHHRSSACHNCRTHLHIAFSRDDGVSWRNVATLEDSMEPNVRIHYPTLLQRGNMLYVLYSRFYLGRCRADGVTEPGEEPKPLCPGLVNPDQGIKLAMIDMTHMAKLPQMSLPSDPDRAQPSNKALFRMLEHFVSKEIIRNMEQQASPQAALAILNRLKNMRWKDTAGVLALIYDLDFVGGAKYLRKKNGLSAAFHTILTQQLPAIKDEYIHRHWRELQLMDPSQFAAGPVGAPKDAPHPSLDQRVAAEDQRFADSGLAEKTAAAIAMGVTLSLGGDSGGGADSLEKVVSGELETASARMGGAWGGDLGAGEMPMGAGNSFDSRFGAGLGAAGESLGQQMGEGIAGGVGDDVSGNLRNMVGDLIGGQEKATSLEWQHIEAELNDSYSLAQAMQDQQQHRRVQRRRHLSSLQHRQIRKALLGR